jgi:iron complex outermembrane receptor protein
MVEDVKSGRTATITTASSQAEVLAEVPVPTTLITEEMIRNSGARNLQEVLATFVPGMTAVDCNDDINIAMRGIYSNGQEKILIMLNGHRLNSYCTNIAAPDYSIGLEKLKQIEVLRGPASSLYGGVALTAVVNLITKQGADVDGIQARAGAGNYGQFRGDLLMGKRYFDLDLLLWGNIYTSKGEVTETSAQKSIYNLEHTECRIGQIGHKPHHKARHGLLKHQERIAPDGIVYQGMMRYHKGVEEHGHKKTQPGLKPVGHILCTEKRRRHKKSRDPGKYQ